MNIKQAKEEIRHTVRAYLEKNEEGDYRIPAIRQRPLLLIGAPGIGKTQIMEQIARECHIGLVSYTITHHTRQSAVGLPMIREEEFGGRTYSVTEYTMSEIIASVYRKQKETGLQEGILFIDEINCVSETLAPTMLQFLQCKRFGNQAVPEGWIIVAAGNPPEYNKSVRDFDMVTLDRVRYLNVEADLEVWKEYAREKRINGAILSYLELKPSQFYRVEADVDGLSFVTARGWEDLSNLMDTYQALGIPVTEGVVHEFLHHADVAEDAAAYFELYRKYEDDYRIGEILEGRVPSYVYARLLEAAFDERLSVVNLVLQSLTNLLDGYGREKYRTDRWYAFLKEYRRRLGGNQAEAGAGSDRGDMAPGAGSTGGCEATNRREGAGLATDPRSCYEALLSAREEALRQEIQAELLTREEAHRKERLLADMTAAGAGIRTGMAPREAFEQARIPFTAQTDRLEQAEGEVRKAMENAFTFMENAFGNGQELVVFVTQLTITPDAAVFLSEHPVERYEAYKEQLLIGTRKAALLEELRH